MRRYQSIAITCVVVITFLSIVGCRSDFNQQLLERELRLQEDQIYHLQDELYDKLRGPAQGMVVLATSFSDKETGGSGRHEPMLMVINFGKGRVFHTTLGHADYSMECVGFITTFNRGCEWAATGKVTQSVPQDFPGPDKTSKRTNAPK